MDPIPAAGETAGNSEYRFRPRMIGGESVFRLMPDALEVEFAKRKQLISYGNVRRLRLSFRPANLAMHRFIAEIWPREGQKILIASVSARGPFHFDNQNAAYHAFVTELCRRVGAVQPQLRLEAGMPRWRWWPAAVFGILTLAAVIYFLGTALLQARFGLFVIIFLFGAVLTWQMASMLFRNRPRSCEMNSIPDEILPKQSPPRFFKRWVS